MVQEQKVAVGQLMSRSQQYFTVKQLAEYSQVGQKTLYEAVRERELAHLAVGKKVVISIKDFEAWFDKNKRKPVAMSASRSVPKAAPRKSASDGIF